MSQLNFIHPVKTKDLFSADMPRREAQFDGELPDTYTTGAVQASFTLKPNHTGLTVKGNVHGTYLLECARCLDDVEVPFETDVEELFVYEHYITPPKAREAELQDSDYFEVVNEDEPFDLMELLRQVVVMEQPNQAVCDTCAEEEEPEEDEDDEDA